MKKLPSTAPVVHADETFARAAGGIAFVHVACTEYLTLMSDISLIKRGYRAPSVAGGLVIFLGDAVAVPGG